MNCWFGVTPPSSPHCCFNLFFIMCGSSHSSLIQCSVQHHHWAPVWVLQWNGVHCQCWRSVPVHSVLAGSALFPALSETQWVCYSYHKNLKPHFFNIPSLWLFSVQISHVKVDFFSRCALSGSEFTPPPVYHHRHSDRPKPPAGTGHSCRQPGWPLCHHWPLLTTRPPGSRTHPCWRLENWMEAHLKNQD